MAFPDWLCDHQSTACPNNPKLEMLELTPLAPSKMPMATISEIQGSSVRGNWNPRRYEGASVNGDFSRRRAVFERACIRTSSRSGRSASRGTKSQNCESTDTNQRAEAATGRRVGAPVRPKSGWLRSDAMEATTSQAAFFRMIVSRKNQAPAGRVSGQRYRRGASTFGTHGRAECEDERARNADCYEGFPTSWNSASIRAMCCSLRTQGLRSARMLTASARW